MKANVILHPTDGSEAAQRALGHAIDLALANGSKLIVLHVQRRHGRDTIPPELRDLEHVEHIRMTEAEVLRHAAKLVADAAADKARAGGLSTVESLVVEGDPASEIVAAVKAHDVDAIVMGSRGLGDLHGLLLGGVSHKVAQIAPCTCIIVR